MCRLLIMTALKNPELAIKFMKQAKTPMSYGNNMGIGFSAVKSDGNFFTERWHDNDLFFNRDKVMSPEVIEQLTPFKERLSSSALKQNYSLQGDMDFSDVRTVTMHTRYATCGKGFENTHPFVDEDTSLVHNGVINNAWELGLNKISTCDSEVALQAYINNGVGANIQNTQAWLDTLTGYWAFGILSRDSSGTRILDVVRNTAGLYAANVPDFGLVLATTDDIITSTCTALGIVLEEKPSLIKANTMYRFNAVTGEMLDKIQVEEKKVVTNYYMSDSEYKSVFGKSKASSNVTPMKKKTLPAPANSTELELAFDFMDDTTNSIYSRLAKYDSVFYADFQDMYMTIPLAQRSSDWYDMPISELVEDIELCAMNVNSGYARRS